MAAGFAFGIDLAKSSLIRAISDYGYCRLLPKLIV
jgi:hypothetical protein